MLLQKQPFYHHHSHKHVQLHIAHCTLHTHTHTLHMYTLRHVCSHLRCKRIIHRMPMMTTTTSAKTKNAVTPCRTHSSRSRSVVPAVGGILPWVNIKRVCARARAHVCVCLSLSNLCMTCSWNVMQSNHLNKLVHSPKASLDCQQNCTVFNIYIAIQFAVSPCTLLMLSSWGPP